MAIGRGEQGIVNEDPGYLSDESDFYGDEAVKQEFEDRASTFNVAEWWKHKAPSLMEIASANVAAETTAEAAVLYNPYEGQFFARQLGETVDEFLERLPPATTEGNHLVPWIFIANPFRKAPTKSKDGRERLAGEGPPDEDSDWAKFVVQGGKLLQELTGIGHEIEKNNLSKTKSTISKAVNIQRDKIVQKILDTAVDLHCTSGKWMIFCTPEEVNAVWSIIARATATNDLGIAAKVAPDSGDSRKSRLICIYTKDFTDIKDVSRVAHKLKDLGLVESRGRGIFYKCDAYTHLGIDSSNEFTIKASLYNSSDIFQQKAGQTKDAKLDGFFYKKRKGDDD